MLRLRIEGMGEVIRVCSLHGSKFNDAGRSRQSEPNILALVKDRQGVPQSWGLWRRRPP